MFTFCSTSLELPCSTAYLQISSTKRKVCFFFLFFSFFRACRVEPFTESNFAVVSALCGVSISADCKLASLECASFSDASEVSFTNDCRAELSTALGVVSVSGFGCWHVLLKSRTFTSASEALLPCCCWCQESIDVALKDGSTLTCTQQWRYVEAAVKTGFHSNRDISDKTRISAWTRAQNSILFIQNSTDSVIVGCQYVQWPALISHSNQSSVLGVD